MPAARLEAISDAVLRAARSRAACFLIAMPIAIACWRSLSVKPVAVAKIADATERRSMFAAISANEPTFRKEVVKDFPADAWSQDDAFHEREFQRTRTVASNRGVRLLDGLMALDEGLRSSHGRYRATVPPCRPRTIY